ncbi:NAD(P)-binding domain-containing protein [Pseudonocardia broussonetiae]|uniref:NAD(P)-binding domain-containing protein n=2 Tax=Pseudonocardia broussonetiae TaxID=2736640 RepID=A0A6M6JUN7_9PSEU|nr:NAD(P)-binding domain-containing protein [Pseudonocardia broussonetiae]
MGHALTQQGPRAGKDFVILDAADRVGASWDSRWDSLRLFTPAGHTALPGLPFPGPPDAYPGKDDVASYLRQYATHFDLPVHAGATVERLTLDPCTRGFVLTTSRGTIRAGRVVAATGPFQVPAVPRLGANLAPWVMQVHSSEYRNPAQLPAGRVLVVGAGNSGAQIATELAATHEVTLAVGTRQPSLPQQLAGRDLFFWLTRTHVMDITVGSRLGQRLATKEALIGTRLRDVARLGVRLTGRLTAADGGTVSFTGSDRQQVDAVVWATGYRPDYTWLPAEAVGADGWPLHRRGVSPVPGLGVLGLPWLHTRGSALVGWVGRDACWLAEQLG